MYPLPLEKYDGYTQYYYEIINGHPDHKKKPPENYGNESLISHHIKVFFHSWVGKEGSTAAALGKAQTHYNNVVLRGELGLLHVFLRSTNDSNDDSDHQSPSMAGPFH